jgi:DNA polymerase-3 subunit chi
MNLSQIVPPGFSRFQSLIEVVGQADDERAAARDRVKFYKDRGYEVRYFDLSER